MDNNELDPVARLRAADPASGVEPRAGFAEDVIARMSGPETEHASGPARVADLAAARTRRRRRWLPIAAVAASIAIVGATGYGLGATTGGVTYLADGEAAPPISLQTGQAARDVAEGVTEPSIGAGDRQMSPLIYPPGYGRNHFTASGLDATAGTGPGYAFAPRAASNGGTVAALVTALGIETPAELRDGGWTAGPQDGTAPSVTVSLDGTLSFYYQNPQINPWMCDKTDAEVCQPKGSPPGETAAIEALRSLIVAVGRDPGAFEFTSHVWENSPTRTAEARPVVDGQRIDQAWSLELAEAGIVNANGALAGIVELGDYPVVSEQEGFERLSDPRFGVTMSIMPFAEDHTVPAPDEWVPPTEPPATPSRGTSVSWPVNEVRIVSARLGLASQWQPDGSVLVVPAYEFTDAEGVTWSVIAVAETMLDFASE